MRMLGRLAPAGPGHDAAASGPDGWASRWSAGKAGAAPHSRPASPDDTPGPSHTLAHRHGRDRYRTDERPSSNLQSTVDTRTALILEGFPGQSRDHGCATRDSNPEPADQESAILNIAD